MSIPPSIARRAYQAAAARHISSFFYVRRIVSTNGSPDEFVVVVCKLAGGGASVPLSLTAVRLSAGGDQSVVFVRSREALANISADIRYTGTGRLAGRWEVVRPGDELPGDDDLVTEATLPPELRARQRRYTELARFNVFLPPTGHVALPGPSSDRLPVDVDGTYFVILRIEASPDDAAVSDLSAVGTGTGVVTSGAVAGFPMPVFRYVVGASSSEMDVADGSAPGNGVRLVLPRAGDSVSVGESVTFGWMERTSPALYRLEIARDDGALVHAAIVPRGLGTYRAPPWIGERAVVAGAQRGLKWRVIVIDDRGREQQSTAWRTLAVRPR
jgi:hypothetical protein